jgi:4-aminobutyrate aminotransferase-like enzyme
MINNHIAYNYDWLFTVKRAKGSYFWDQNNRKFLDFASGWNVTNLGWNHPEVSSAMIKQIKKNVYVPMEMGEEVQYEYAKTLLKTLPEELNVISRVTGGTEANEQAIKIARAATGRKKILGFYDTYHGESLGDLSIGYRKEYVARISPLVPEFLQLEYPTTFLSHKSEKETLHDFLNLLEGVLRKKDVAALVTEPGMITGWGSTYVAPKGFLKEVRRLTEEYGTLLILDEVGTGFSRTGKLFGMQHEKVTPDIATFAKGISNGGAAIGAVVTKRDILEPVQKNTFLISTFGWTPVACAAALATLNVHIRDKVWLQSEEKGNWLKKELLKQLKNHPKVGEVRGMGMELGLVFVNNKSEMKPDMEFANKVCAKALENNLVLNAGDEGSIQLMPALTTPLETLTEGINKIVKSIDQVSTANK